MLLTEIRGVLSLGSSRISHMARNGIRPMSVKTRETLSSKCQSLAAPIGIYVFESADSCTGEPTTTTVAPISVLVYYASILLIQISVFCDVIMSRLVFFTHVLGLFYFFGFD